MIRCSFITQSLVWYKKCSFRKCFKTSARSGRNYFSHTIPNQPIQNLCRRSGTYRCLTKCDLFSLIFSYVNRIILRCTNKMCYLSYISRSFFADSSYMLSFSVLCSCVCSRLISPSVSSWHKQDNTLMHQSPGHIQRRTPYNF